MIGPDIGVTMPEMVLNSVVLPAPFGPTIDDELPFVDRDRDAVQDGQVASSRR